MPTTSNKRQRLKENTPDVSRACPQKARAKHELELKKNSRLGNSSTVFRTRTYYNRRARSVLDGAVWATPRIGSPMVVRRRGKSFDRNVPRYLFVFLCDSLFRPPSRFLFLSGASVSRFHQPVVVEGRTPSPLRVDVRVIARVGAVDPNTPKRSGRRRALPQQSRDVFFTRRFCREPRHADRLGRRETPAAVASPSCSWRGRTESEDPAAAPRKAASCFEGSSGPRQIAGTARYAVRALARRSGGGWLASRVHGRVVLATHLRQ